MAIQSTEMNLGKKKKLKTKNSMFAQLKFNLRVTQTQSLGVRVRLSSDSDSVAFFFFFFFWCKIAINSLVILKINSLNEEKSCRNHKVCFKARSKHLTFERAGNSFPVVSRYNIFHSAADNYQAHEHQPRQTFGCDRNHFPQHWLPSTECHL